MEEQDLSNVSDRQMIQNPDGSMIEGPRMCPLCWHHWAPDHQNRGKGCQVVENGDDRCGCPGPNEWWT